MGELFSKEKAYLKVQKRKLIICLHKQYSIDQRKMFISKKYLKYLGYPMDWMSPKSYTQKIQYSKLFNNDPRRTLCSDKVAVRDFVKKKIGEKYLIPIYGVWDSFDSIDFTKLPEKFVLKTNHGSATNLIVRNKSAFNVNKARSTMIRFLKDDFAFYGFEMQYAAIKPVIYAEQCLSFDCSGIEDYKFLCFDGVVKYFWIDFNRYSNHKRNMYDLNWNLQAWNQWTYGNYEGVVKKPDNFSEMIDIAQKLSRGFDHVRVDLYNVNGKIYFGELTFTNGGGYENILPIESDFELGKLWELRCN